MLKKIKLNYFYSIYLYISLTPLIFSVFFEKQREEDFVFCFISSFLFVIPYYIFKNPKIYTIFSSFLLFMTGVFDLVHIYLYQGRITSSIFFIILDTNPVESSEFISSNITFGLIASLSLYLFGFLFLALQVRKAPNHLKQKGLSLGLALWIIVPFGVKYLTSSFNFEKTVDAYTRSNQLFLMTKTYLDYQKQMKIFTSFANKAKKVENVSRTTPIDGAEIHVLVIGESTTRTHMSLYGYHRKTNPKLESIRDELVVFNDVANSQPPGTASNLKRINTLASETIDSSEALSISLVNIMKGAGFKTYWISNQLLLGDHDTVTTALAKQADTHVFTNTTNSITYDEKLLPILENKLKDKVKKKFIVIHLFGTHMKYRFRFPDEYKQFIDTSDIPKKPFHGKKELQYINDYDNAVLYNDHIVFEILKILKKQNTITSFIYLSDHGEEVYENKDLHGHPSVDSRAVYEVPFIAWGSSEYKEKFNDKYSLLQSSINRPYAHDNVIHTLMDMYKINYKEFKPELSLINSLFKKPSRYIDKIAK